MAMFVDDTIVYNTFNVTAVACCTEHCVLHCLPRSAVHACPIYVQHNEWTLSVSHTSLPLHLCSMKLKKMELQLKQFREKYLEM